MQSLKAAIERLASQGEVERDPEARRIFMEFRDQLTQGSIRAAEKVEGQWAVNTWVKQGILLGFRLGQLASGTWVALISANTSRTAASWPSGSGCEPSTTCRIRSESATSSSVERNASTSWWGRCRTNPTVSLIV